MVFMLSTEFRGVEEEIAPMCLGPREAVFEKLEESSQHLKPLYIRGHINKRSISRMLIDSDAANLIPYSVFKKLGIEDDDLVKTNLTLNGVGGQPYGSHCCRLHGAYRREQVALYLVLCRRDAR
jgi:hypothetical protein